MPSHFELRCENPTRRSKSVWGRLCYRCDKGIFQRRVPRISVASLLSGANYNGDSKINRRSDSIRLDRSDLAKVCPSDSSSYYCGFRPTGCDRNAPVFSHLKTYSLELGEHKELLVIEDGQSRQTPSFALRPPFGEALEQGLYKTPKHEHFLRPGLRFHYEYQSQAELEIRNLRFDTEGRPVVLEADIRHTCGASEAWSRICVACEPRP